MQLMEILDHTFKVNILAVSINNKSEFNFSRDYSWQDIPNYFIVKKRGWIILSNILIIVISNIL